MVLHDNRVHLREDIRPEGDHLAVEACLRVVEAGDHGDWILGLALGLGRLGRRGGRLGDVGQVGLGMEPKGFSLLL